MPRVANARFSKMTETAGCHKRHAPWCERGRNPPTRSSSSISEGQREWAYQSFKLSQITTVSQLFEEEPELKIDDLELSDGNVSLTVSLTAGVEAIELARERLAEKIRVGVSVDSIDESPVIVASPSADGISLTFTIVKPTGDKGFVRVQMD